MLPTQVAMGWVTSTEDDGQAGVGIVFDHYT